MRLPLVRPVQRSCGTLGQDGNIAAHPAQPGAAGIWQEVLPSLSLPCTLSKISIVLNPMNLNAYKRIEWSHIQLIPQVIKNIVEGDDGDIGDPTVFEFGEGGATGTHLLGEGLLREVALLAKTANRATKFE